MKIVIKQTDVAVRNPVAAELHTAQYRKRVVRDKTKYTRKKKHKGKE